MNLRLPLSCLLALAGSPGLRAQETAPDPAVFRDPPGEYKAIHWVSYFLSRASEESLTASVRAAAQSGAWGSFELGPGGGPTTGLSPEYLAASQRTPSTAGVPYLSDEYFRLYRAAIEEGQKDHFPASMVYDEWAYPAGIVGGQFYSQHPDLMGKSLEMAEKDVAGPAQAGVKVPAGLADYIGAVLMNLDTFERRDVSGGFHGGYAGTGGIVSAAVPAGRWKLMAFYLNGKFRPASQKGGAVDYLDRDAVATYIAMSYQKYYDHLKDYFGTVIKRSFYDEPSMHLVDGRMWSPHFNRDYQAKYGRSPMTLYPALWYDIGPDTAAARNALFGFHAELYAENYIGQVARWCQDHGIQLAGHQDQEEVPNPVAITGDMMKVFEHQQVPGIDDIYYPGRTLVSYKIVTSAAWNYDWPECIAETFAAYRKRSAAIDLRTILDQAAMGINMVMDARRNQLERPAGNRPPGNRPGGNRPPTPDIAIDPATYPLIGRLDYLLRGGRHVADVAVVYPIASLQSVYYFAQPVAGQREGDTGFTYSVEGGVLPPEIDYQDVGEILYRSLRVDYTYLHPEVLAGRCQVEGKRLVLENKHNREEYRVVVLPGGNTVAAATAARLREFYRAGGTVIATSELPTKSAEFGRDREVRAAMEEIFGMPWEHPMTAEARIVPDEVKDYFVHGNVAGGRAYFIPRPDPKILGSVLQEADPVRDVNIRTDPAWPLLGGTAYTGALTYLHKVKGGRDIYFFSNTTERPVDVKVTLRGAKNLRIWDPHRGEVRAAEATASTAEGEAVTDVPLTLPPVHALFYLTD